MALLPLFSAQSPTSAPSGGAQLTPAPAAQVDPLTPAVAEIAWRDPKERIQVIAQFKPEFDRVAALESVRANGGKVISEIGLIHGIAAEMTAGDAAELARQAGVHAVSLNGGIETHDLEISPKQLKTSFNQSVRSPQVWYGGKYQGTGEGVTVAVIDTGIQGDHPDFRRSERDSTSRVKASAVINPDATGAGDGYGHGTHIAGLIAGNGENRNDALDGSYAGVAPEAELVDVKVSDEDGNATVLDVIYGLQFVVDHRDELGIDVVNLSLNSTVAESYLTDPLDAAAEEAWFSGIVVVTAVGNRASDPDATHYAPANDPFVISVGAVDDKGTKKIEDDTLAEWSSRGKTQDGFDKPDLLAPGAHIRSTLAKNSKIASLCPECVHDTDYFQMGGTSMAAGVASGIVALLLEEHSEWTPDEVKGAIENMKRDVPGVGAEAAADKAIKAPVRKRRANEGLVPNSMIDPATGKIDFGKARWTKARWTDATELLKARWTSASWSKARWTAAEETQMNAADTTKARWTKARWTTSFSK